MTNKGFLTDILPVLLLTAVTIAVYGRIIGHDFLMNWDDNAYITANSAVHGFSARNVRAVFTSFYAGNYAPLQMLSYMLDYTLWGLWPGGFLLTNVVLHTMNGLLVYLLLLKLQSEKMLAAVAAGIFLLHPLQVESVAWISQRKNLLAMLFMLLSWQAYICYRNSSQEGRLAYFLSIAAFLCSLLAKSATVFFPIALLLNDYCFSARGQRAKLLDKIPYFVLALAAALLALRSQSPDVTGWSGLDYGGRSTWHGGSPWATLLTMMPVLCSYLRMILWPSGLSAVYSPVIYKTLEFQVVAAFLLIFFIGWMIYRLFRTDCSAGYWPLFSLLALLPVVQLVPLVTLMNDRYLYFPMIGLAALGGIGTVTLKRWVNEKVALGLVLVILLLLALASYDRAGIWKNSKTLWTDAVKKSPEKFDAWEGLGEANHLSEPVRLRDAEYAYSRAFALYSSGPVNLFNFAKVKLLLGEEARGQALLQRLLKINPEHVMGWAALGDSYASRQNYSAAAKAYKTAETLQPDALEVNLRLYGLYTATGEVVAAKYYQGRVLKLGGNISILNP